MSDNWIVLIPQDPTFAPSETARVKAKAFLADICPRADEVVDELANGVRFFDCCANHERTTCPACDSDVDDDWWLERMRDAYDEKKETFRLQALALPCCAAQFNLNELVYFWIQGFARYALEVMNPRIGRLSEHDKAKIEGILNCPLKVIYRHI